MTKTSVAPGDGERRAQRGYGRQYQSAGAAIYAALDRADFLWVGLADRSAGIADDLVLGFTSQIVGHQFKTSQFPGKFTLRTLLMGANGLLKPLVDAWKHLKHDHPSLAVHIHLVTNDFPSTDDSLSATSGCHSAEFLHEFALHPDRPLSQWRATAWQSFIDEMFHASELDDVAFEEFLQGFNLVFGAAADFIQLHRLSTEGARLAADIATLLPKLVADPRGKDRWTRAELLHELNWRDSAITRHSHFFPVGAYLQPNKLTEDALREAIHGALRGYVALIGPPGAGKSTLLQTALATEAGLLVVRYLAYVPGVGQGIGRGEADDFLDDVAAQLKNSGLHGVRFRNDTLLERREQFGALLREAGQRYQNDQIRTLIVVDGLDHVPREEHPTHSFLAELPLPDAIPEGVLFVLGTQRLDLKELKPAVRSQAGTAGRKVDVAPLTREAVHRMADQLELDESLPRDKIFELSLGHPLVTRYVIEALRDADENTRTQILAGAMRFEGDIEALYDSAWRCVEDDDDASNVLGYLARAEGPMPLSLLAQVIPEAAIERALKLTKHLLIQNPKGWGVFHNSFRLFILGKPRFRLGEVDGEYSARVYRQLAKLARVATTNTAQRWLELRYAARAGDDADVLRLAEPRRFREQLAQGRLVSDIQGDIRLAYSASIRTHDAITVLRLLLAQDEIRRRAEALEYTADLPKAFLAVGNIDTAQTLAEEYGNHGYEVVEALLDRGEFGRARELFEKLEPLQQLLTGRLDEHKLRRKEPKLFGWARQVIHFRDMESINKAIQRLSTASARAFPHEQETDAAELASELRYAVALSILESDHRTDVAETAQKLNVPTDQMLYLRAEAGLSAYKRAARERAFALLQSAVVDAHFVDLPNAWRRQIAWIFARAGSVTTASQIFDELVAPTISQLDKETHGGAPEHVTRAIIEHAKLATFLGRHIEEGDTSKHAILQPLQFHATAVGVLLGRLHRAGNVVAYGEVSRATQTALAYLSQVRIGRGSDLFVVQKIVASAPVLGRAFIEAAALSGEKEFQGVLAAFDQAIATADNQSGIRDNLQRHIALAIYRATGNTLEASRRLAPLIQSLHEATPSTQLDSLTTFAIAYAKVGDYAQAQALLDRIPFETLGYSLPPKRILNTQRGSNCLRAPMT